jgi:hypothetical protein
MEQAQKAWKEFESILLALDSEQTKNLRVIETAYIAGFKKGYEQGMAEQSETKTKRKAIVTRKHYTPEQHAEMVETVLLEAGRAMRPIEIAAAIKKRFGVKWNDKSITGHLRTAMRYNTRIIKIGVGLYGLKEYAEQAKLDLEV